MPVLAREGALGASADDSVYPLTRATRELALCSSTDALFFLRCAQQIEPDLIPAEQHGIAGTLAGVLRPC